MLFNRQALSYSVAYLIPALTFVGLAAGGPWLWLSPVTIFGIIPLLDRPGRQQRQSRRKPPATAAAIPTASPIYNWLLYLNVPVLYGLWALFAHTLVSRPLSPAEVAGTMVTMGLSLGILGIGVGHELGHRSSRWAQVLAKLLLLTNLYLHFFIEHNRGHHRYVATPLDPATARLNEPFWLFFPRAVVGEYRSAWHLEQVRLAKQGLPWLSFANQMLRFQLLQLVVLAAVGLTLGGAVVAAWLGAAVVGLLLFQLVNYIEHYGLQRQLNPNGRYERVQPHHSWDSNHKLGRLLLYELTRHSDHHYLASRPYQALRYQPTSPRMPTGYPGMMMLAMLPPLWFRVMNKRIPQPMTLH
ncbi:alkane 1-monooxygenase [Hymenobacter lutimineralis]|uniref:Alkane 1-monooxygenase n=1 Tax=Hymenobacter lutimineralis TaxID=2606448 RepID=A0A5D6UU48_9BACT|nr:alkane 1-monooxygenase [Hymenobacter lutimineralis]TYZ05869.1 alkane 1-monooxygenase [Hymenobacter lutimineralis]